MSKIRRSILIINGYEIGHNAESRMIAAIGSHSENEGGFGECEIRFTRFVIWLVNFKLFVGNL